MFLKYMHVLFLIVAIAPCGYEWAIFSRTICSCVDLLNKITVHVSIVEFSFYIVRYPVIRQNDSRV